MVSHLISSTFHCTCTQWYRFQYQIMVCLHHISNNLFKSRYNHFLNDAVRLSLLCNIECYVLRGFLSSLKINICRKLEKCF